MELFSWRVVFSLIFQILINAIYVPEWVLCTDQVSVVVTIKRTNNYCYHLSPASQLATHRLKS